MNHPFALTAEEVSRLKARGVMSFRLGQPSAHQVPAVKKSGAELMREVRATFLAAGLTTMGTPRKRQWKRCGNSRTNEYHRTYMKQWRERNKARANEYHRDYMKQWRERNKAK